MVHSELWVGRVAFATSGRFNDSAAQPLAAERRSPRLHLGIPTDPTIVSPGSLLLSEFLP